MLIKLMTTTLHKAQICAFLGLPSSVRTSKAELIAQLLQHIDADPDEYTRLLDTFVNELAVGPAELEEMLHCTKVERIRWIKEGRLPSLEYRSFRKAGKDLSYPVHDRRLVLALSQEEITRWREEHQTHVQESRKQGVRTAAVQRNANRQRRQDFLTSWLHLVAEWIQRGSPALAAVLQLAYWTVWVSRWAKECRLKALRSTRHATTYAERGERWYERKNEAMQTLARTPYARLSFYRPDDADKWSFDFCSEHEEERREDFYEDRWEFYALHGAEIRRCPTCQVRVEKDYYSLYFLEIGAAEFPDVRFSFHMPYPIGKAFFPNPKKLPLVEHMEQDGPFRFGRALLAQEKVTHRERDVLAQFEQALIEVRQWYRLNDAHPIRAPSESTDV